MHRVPTLIASAMALGIALPSQAVGTNPVPKTLFGVELGHVFTASEDNPAGDLQIEKWTGSKRFLGAGVHYYFKPLRTYKEFEYIENNPNGNEYFETSFRLYNFQIIPDGVRNISELEQLKTFKSLISLISWSVPFDDNEKGYYWAWDMCKVFSADISVEPMILDMYDLKNYRCIFKQDDRELEIWSFGSITLQYTSDKRDNLQDSLQNQINQLRANDIKPY